MRLVCSLFLAAGISLAACGGDDDGSAEPEWQLLYDDLDAAFLSVWGTASDDVGAAGRDPESDGPMVKHLTGDGWTDVAIDSPGDLWWVFGVGGKVYLGGAGGRILVSDDGVTFEEMTTPSSTPIVFGIWGCSADDLWAVGGNQGGSMGGFAWHLEGGEWVQPDSFPAEIATDDAVWKVSGNACDDVWMVGTDGLVVHWDGEAFGDAERVGGESLFTDASDGELTVAVGGFGTGRLYEHDGDGWGENLAPADADALVGVCTGGGDWYATGWFASVMQRDEAGDWARLEHGLPIDATLHSCWVDPDGGFWAVGGQVAAIPLVDGVMVHFGNPVETGNE